MSDDLYTRPHFHAPGRPYMSGHDRAAQFAPFKSLTGFEAMIDDAKKELDTPEAHWELDDFGEPGELGDFGEPSQPF